MRRRFVLPRRRREAPTPIDDAAAAADNMTEAAVDGPVDGPIARLWHGSCGLKQIALDLWAPDYSVLFEAEFTINELACGGSGYNLPPTTYRTRLKGEAAERYDWRRRQQKRDEMAIALHANNMQQWSPSLLARSVAYFNLTTIFLHGEETRQRRIASRPTTMQFLRLMRDCRPQVAWDKASHVSFYVADQTYEWIGMKKRGARKTLERLDPTGMPVVITHEVYINSIKLQLPHTLGTLSAADIATIANSHGSPYTEDFNLVFVPLQPVTVMASLVALACDALQLVEVAAVGAEVAPAGLTLRALASALYGRPNIDPGGPSEFEILEPLMRTDTKSYNDFIKISAHCSAHSSPDGVVDVFCGDGQSVISFKNLKKRWPMRYAQTGIEVWRMPESTVHMVYSTVQRPRVLTLTLRVAVPYVRALAGTHTGSLQSVAFTSMLTLCLRSLRCSIPASSATALTSCKLSASIASPWTLSIMRTPITRRLIMLRR